MSTHGETITRRWQKDDKAADCDMVLREHIARTRAFFGVAFAEGLPGKPRIYHRGEGRMCCLCMAVVRRRPSTVAQSSAWRRMHREVLVRREGYLSDQVVTLKGCNESRHLTPFTIRITGDRDKLWSRGWKFHPFDQSRDKQRPRATKRAARRWAAQAHHLRVRDIFVFLHGMAAWCDQAGSVGTRTVSRQAGSLKYSACGDSR